MNISDWVHACHDMNKITGFITDVINEQVTIQVTIPKNYGNIVLNREQVWRADDTIWMDDIPCLIDLSLWIQDKPWFLKWVHELSLWKPAQTMGEYGF